MNAAAMKLSPPVAVAAAQVSAEVTGWGPQEWMYVLTAVYVVIQAAYLLWKWIKEIRSDDDEPDAE